MKNIYGFISTSISTQQPKLPNGKTAYSGLRLKIVVASPPLGHVVNINGFISNFISVVALSWIDRIVDQIRSFFFFILSGYCSAK